ncbi:MAG: tRNA (adenosine(37)-N6)-dimethylallyltransferase MiaA [Dehalococcoidia bacterium]|nr:MAG: tRNA (adenosine(37)-N6)-dimethylallyltransferase MiaA [Dehalococcoidia bacterium]
MTQGLIAIVGPTATGKTALAIALAQRLDGEIVGADSRQVYRHMDIGTAKPTAKERSLAAHHLIDVIDPDQEFSLAQYLEQAVAVLEDVWSRGKQPLLVGGSGQYVWALLEGWRVPRLQPQRELRRELEERAARQGAEALHRELAQVDPKAAARIDPRNVRRVIRALEVHKATGRPISYWQEKGPPPWEVLILGLTCPRQVLYERIDARVDAMMEVGLVDEVRGLLSMGYDPSLASMSGIGYKQICQHLAGELDLATAVARIKTATHRLARQQYTWFRLDDQRIRWIDISLGAPFEEAARFVKSEPGSGRRVAHGR